MTAPSKITGFLREHHPHRRLNPLTGQWTLVSPQRNLRPWQGAASPPEATLAPHYDPSCYLCPGNDRVTGARNPQYDGPFVFGNDFPALIQKVPPALELGDPLFQCASAQGTCRVVCFSPDHRKGLAELPSKAVQAVVDTWCQQSEALGAMHRWVQIFENKGAAMGCSNPHPHSQIWATDFLPNEAVTEDRCQRAYFDEHRRALLLDYALREAQSGERTVVQGQQWLAVVPYWAAWPFETLVLPLMPVQRLSQLDAHSRLDLAEVLRKLTTRYDNLFQCAFPYSMGWHGAPYGAGQPDEACPHWQLHAHFYPPLLRSASVRKYMVGFEMLAEPQRDITPEDAATHLRALTDEHFLCKGQP